MAHSTYTQHNAKRKYMHLHKNLEDQRIDIQCGSFDPALTLQRNVPFWHLSHATSFVACISATAYIYPRSRKVSYIQAEMGFISELNIATALLVTVRTGFHAKKASQHDAENY